MAEIQLPTLTNIRTRTEALLKKPFVDDSLGKTGAYTFTQFYAWVKDAYDKCVDSLKMPRSSAFIQPTANVRSYPVPSDSYDNFNGIISITFADTPLIKLPLEDAIERFGHGIDYTDPINQGQSWYNNPGINGIVFYLKEDSETSFTVVNTPSASDVTNKFQVYYLQAQPEPTSMNDVMPAAYVPLLADFPLYIVGRALESEKNGRGAALIEEWEARLLKRKARSARQGRRTIAEAYSQDMDAYGKLYKGRLGGYFR